MSRQFIVEVKTLNEDQHEIVVGVDDNGIAYRVNENGEEVRDIVIVPPATHDIIDILNTAQKGQPYLKCAYDFLTQRPAFQGQQPQQGVILAIDNAGRELTIGEIQSMNTPVIDAAIVQIGKIQNAEHINFYSELASVGYINFIDAR